MTAEEAVRSILALGEGLSSVMRRGNTDDGDLFAREAAAISRGNLEIDVNSAFRIFRKLRNVRGVAAADESAIKAAIALDLLRRWPELEEEIVAQVAGELGLILEHVRLFEPVLSASDLLAAHVLNDLQRSKGSIPTWPFAALCLSKESLRRVVELKRVGKFVDFERDAEQIFAKSRAPSLWRKMLAAVLEVPAEPEIADLVKALELLPLGTTKPAFDLALASPETRSGWRQTVIEAVRAVPGSSGILLEMILWFTPGSADKLMMPLARELCNEMPTDCEDALKEIADHPNAAVRARAAALRADPHFDITDERTSPDLLGTVLLHTKPRESEGSPLTWLGNRDVERLLESSIASVASRYAESFEAHWREDEEPLSTRLVERLRVALQEVEELVANNGQEGGATTRLGFTLHERIVPKVEEGDDGFVPGTKFATDICFIIEARRQGECFSKRASLVQVKKLRMNERAHWEPSYTVKMKQLKHIASSTASSFYLFLGPEEGGRCLPVVPARLLEDLLEPGAEQRSFNRSELGRVSRALSQWLTYDLIGLWTGDPKVAAVEKAAGDEGRRPYLMVELTVELSDHVESK